MISWIVYEKKHRLFSIFFIKYDICYVYAPLQISWHQSENNTSRCDYRISLLLSFTARSSNHTQTYSNDRYISNDLPETTQFPKLHSWARFAIDLERDTLDSHVKVEMSLFIMSRESLW